jgi:hypothetical protein
MRVTIRKTWMGNSILEGPNSGVQRSERDSVFTLRPMLYRAPADALRSRKMLRTSRVTTVKDDTLAGHAAFCLLKF